MKDVVKGALLALAVLLQGCEPTEKTAETQTPAVPKVDIATVTPSTEPLTTRLTGRMEAYRTAEVRARVEGIVEARTYQEGQEVKAGTLLFRIDPAPLKAELAAAEAELAQARAAADAAEDIAKRSRQLMADESISAQQYRKDFFTEKQARATQKAAEAKVQSARLKLAYANVTSPIAGRARRAEVTEGALVGQDEGTKLTTVEQIDPIYVNFAQPMADSLALRQSLQQADKREKPILRLRLSNGSTYPLNGTLLFSDWAVDEKTDTVAMRAIFDNPDHLLLPGMYVQVELQQPGQTQAVLIPQQALTRTREGAYTMVVDESNHAHSRPISADTLEGSQWRVTDGLKAGERVILSGSALKDGQAVEPKQATLTTQPVASKE
ncbi:MULTISPECIES: efflux RND transporter periplasmic adaptor subunit [Pseudomonas]|uniref:Efflux RND transporter periplasmic adaptor subunit n=1 Tax=Pseudomonas luteola TaxID=47886 RepID=A0ABS0FQB2_PSELU|nr:MULTISPECIES: efflux RND transporter periplasmic adaptor subunit [Pseudomonas]MBF8642487.1 efflux RND transporter periplasmic adaptor subunit [Pseudomonas zeshuii]RRW46465.1 efflux RND transporter periplasmic adaptor subunit [Pseudomonas luteola]SHJ34455.1 membrane fusion protein, multidrug efflux system [Pseudomonas zeshuii]